MAFRTYQTLGEVLKTYKIQYVQAPFPLSDPIIPAPVRLKEDLLFTQQTVYYRNSEAAVCENLIYPILKEVWRPFIKSLAIWSHEPIRLNDELNGVPDYIFSRQSELGKAVFETPYVAVVEAKRGNFDYAWPQCCLEMYTIQQLNQDNRPVFGVVSNGDIWEIAQLEEQVFTQFTGQFTLDRLDELFSALTWVLETCKRIYNL